MLNMQMAFRAWIAAILLLTALAISENTAVAQCPPVGANSDCGTIITIDDTNGSVVSHTARGPYDEIDDTLVGVINNSSQAILSIGLRSGIAIFEFDGDGICGNSPITGLPYSPRPNGCPFGPTTYEGPGVSFTNIHSNFTEGTVNFAPSIVARGGRGYFSLEAAISADHSCQDAVNHSLRTFTSDSGPHVGVVMNAEFTPIGGPTKAARDCGVDTFNWISEITVPYPVPYLQNPTPGTRLLPDIAYNDPPARGYTYDTTWNSFPYYWDINTNNTAHSLNTNLTATALKFLDKPTDACLPGGTVGNPECLNTLAAAGSVLKFKTRVVGIHNSAPVELGIFFKWESSFNGYAGGVSRTANLQDPDPGIGTGGITITDVHDVSNSNYNGIAVTTVNGAPIEGETKPPTITVSATPSKLWPPNKLIVPVTVSGTMKDTGGSGVNLSTAAYVVMDEYGLVQPKGAVTPGSDGSYSFIIQLQASRKGDDEDGRQYRITVSVEDDAGNKGSSSTQVIVPHDQRHDRKHDREDNRDHDRKDDRGNNDKDNQKHGERGDRSH
jgi:hypothetical protein